MMAEGREGLRVWLKEIAKMAGVSQSALSIVRTGKPGVSPETRLRLQKLLFENGYTYLEYNGKELPKRSHRTLPDPCLRLVKFTRDPLVAAGGESYVTGVIKALEADAKRRKYRLLISAADPSGMPLVLDSFDTIACDGAFVLATEMEEADVAQLARIRVPVLLMDCDLVSAPYSCVTVNNREIAADAARYLRTLGHTRVGCIGSSAETSNFRAREQGFAEAAARIGLRLEARPRLRPTLDGAQADMARWLEADAPLPTAFFAVNDVLAVGAMRALRARGLRVPDDVSVMGVDNAPFAAVATPPLTTVNVYCESVSRRSMSLLQHAIRAERAQRVKVLLSGNLIERRSTAAPRTEEPAIRG